MMKRLAALPPTHAFLLDEPSLKGKKGVPIERLVADTGFRRALRNAADESFSAFPYPDAVQHDNPTELVLAPTGSLDPFYTRFACTELPCLTDRTTRLARLMALYSDHAIVPDSITEVVTSLDLRRRSTRERLVQKLEILKTLRPLVDAGILRFGMPHAVFCPKCDPGLQERFTAFIAATSDAWLAHASISDDGAQLTLDLSAVLGVPGAVWQTIVSAPTAAGRSAVVRSAVNSIAGEYVTRLFINCRAALHSSALLLSGEALETATVQRLAADVTKKGPLRDFSRLASLELPWISSLNVREVLALRETAASALPRLRERLAQRLLRDDTPSDRARTEAIQELRVEAEEVRSELAALGSRNERIFESLLGGLALSVSVGGVATGMVPAGVALAGLLSALGSIHTHHNRRSTAESSLKGRPAYALVAAKDLLGSRGHGTNGAV